MKKLLLSILLIFAFCSQALAGGLGNFADFSLDWSGSGQNYLKFFAPLTSTDNILTPTRGKGVATFSRTSSQIITDFEGNARSVVSGSVGVEGSRVVTNYLLQSYNLSSLPWSTSAVTFGTPIISPTGSTAQAIIGANSYAAHGVLQNISGLSIAGHTYLWQVVVKSGNTNWIDLRDGQQTNDLAWFDLANGAVGTTGSGATAGIIALGNGWYRCWARYKVVSSGALRFSIYPTDADNTIYHTGDGVTVNLYATDAQIEDVTFQYVQIPGEYSGTTTAANTKCFNTKSLLFLAVTGDSIAAGHNTSNPYYPPNFEGGTGRVDSEIMYRMTRLFGDFTYQNYAKGSQTYSWVASTGAVSAIDTGARAILIHCGVNDIAASRTWSDIEADLNTIKGKLSTDQKLFIDEILPWTNGSDAQSATVRTYNTNLATWCANNNAILISSHDAMGQIRTSTGYLDDLKTAYNQDGVHVTQAGVDALAGIWLAALQNYYGEPIPLSNLVSQPISQSLLLGYASDPTLTTVLSYPFPTGTKTFAIKFTPSTTSQTGAFLWGSYTSADNYAGALYDGANFVCRKRIGGTNYDSVKATTLAAGTTYDVACRQNNDNTLDIFVNQVKGTPNANTTAPVYASTWQIGSDGNGANQVTGSLRNAKAWRNKHPDSYLQKAANY